MLNVLVSTSGFPNDADSCIAPITLLDVSTACAHVVVPKALCCIVYLQVTLPPPGVNVDCNVGFIFITPCVKAPVVAVPS